MIDFQPLSPENKARYEQLLFNCGERGCEYSFANLYLWGRQKAALVHDNLVFFSQYNRRSIYPFPVGSGDLKATIDAIIQDAQKRGIPCRLTSLTPQDCAKLESLYPGKFRFHHDRDFFDYVYNIDALADLKGKKLQRKRNHINKFIQLHPEYTTEPITANNAHEAQQLISEWYRLRLEEEPHSDFHMEQAAIAKALQHREMLSMDGLLLKDGHQTLAMTIGSRLSQNTFDIHFEKALDRADGAYAVINREFARYLREKYPDIRYLNREDDMGLEGLRKAKLSYYPDHFVEKSWACLLEDGYDY